MCYIHNMKSTCTCTVNDDAQICSDFEASDELGNGVTGRAFVTRAGSLAIAQSVLDRRPDVARDAERVARIVAALRAGSLSVADDIEAGRL